MHPPSVSTDANALFAIASGSGTPNAHPICASGSTGPASDLGAASPHPAARVSPTQNESVASCCRAKRPLPKSKQGPTCERSRPAARVVLPVNNGQARSRSVTYSSPAAHGSAQASPAAHGSAHGSAQASPPSQGSAHGSAHGSAQTSPLHGSAAGVVSPVLSPPPQATRLIIPTARTAVRRKLI